MLLQMPIYGFFKGLSFIVFFFSHVIKMYRALACQDSLVMIEISVDKKEKTHCVLTSLYYLKNNFYLG